METIKEVLRNNLVRLLDKSVTGVQLSEISRQMQVSQTTVSRWKNGENSPELDKIDRLAEILKVDPIEFFRTGKEIGIVQPVSKTLKKMMCVPDDIYDLAGKLGDIDAEAWHTVRSALEIAIESKAAKSRQA